VRDSVGAPAQLGPSWLVGKYMVIAGYRALREQDAARASPEHHRRVVKDQVSDALSVRSPQ
jgi:hypothetical protein